MTQPRTTATEAVSKAAVEVGNVMLTGGQVGLMIYALLLIIGVLLVFMFLKEWLNQRQSMIGAAALKEAAKAIDGLNIQVTRLESTNGQLLSILLSREGFRQAPEDRS